MYYIRLRGRAQGIFGDNVIRHPAYDISTYHTVVNRLYKHFCVIWE